MLNDPLKIATSSPRDVDKSLKFQRTYTYIKEPFLKER